ncbi:MAG: hypothetical protein ACLSD6_06910 [Clostridium sp.]
MKDLGMHTELCSDVSANVFAGKLTNGRKLEPGKGVFGCALVPTHCMSVR